MTISTNGQNFVLELAHGCLFIRLGQYEFSLTHNTLGDGRWDYCLCKGLKTVWANWS